MSRGLICLSRGCSLNIKAFNFRHRHRHYLKSRGLYLSLVLLFLFHCLADLLVRLLRLSLKFSFRRLQTLMLIRFRPGSKAAKPEDPAQIQGFQK